MNVWIRSVKILELLLSKVCKIAIIFQRMFLRLLPFSLLCIYIFVHVFDHVHSTYVMSACLSLGLSVCIYVYVCTCGWLHACIYLRKHVYIFTLWFAHLNIYKFSYKCRFVLVLLTLVIAIILLLSFSPLSYVFMILFLYFCVSHTNTQYVGLYWFCLLLLLQLFIVYLPFELYLWNLVFILLCVTYKYTFCTPRIFFDIVKTCILKCLGVGEK